MATRADSTRADAAAARADADLPLAEVVCLTLIAQGATHGWHVGTMLAPNGEIGRIWSLSRPLTYRAIDQLAEKKLVRRTATARERGRERQLLRVTPRGQRVSEDWLATPVDHLRDVRTELLLKLTLRQRAGLAVEPLVRAQQQRFGPLIEALTSGPSPSDLVALWRRESARAVRRFLNEALRSPAAALAPQTPPIRISARNQLAATVSAITHGDVISSVKATLGDGQSVTAAITNESIADLDLAQGDDVIVVIKSTEVMIAKHS